MVTFVGVRDRVPLFVMLGLSMLSAFAGQRTLMATPNQFRMGDEDLFANVPEALRSPEVELYEPEEKR
jgi:hypothetical protein